MQLLRGRTAETSRHQQKPAETSRNQLFFFFCLAAAPGGWEGFTAWFQSAHLPSSILAAVAELQGALARSGRHTHAHIPAYVRTHIRIYMYIYAHTRTHTTHKTRTLTHTPHTYTRARTHAHTPALLQSRSPASPPVGPSPQDVTAACRSALPRLLGHLLSQSEAECALSPHTKLRDAPSALLAGQPAKVSCARVLTRVLGLRTCLHV